MPGRLLAAFVMAVVLVGGLASAANAKLLISIDKRSQRMAVVVDGTTRYVWPVSTGARGYDTPSGSYTPFRLERDHYSKEWDDAPMPYSIFFTTRGHAIHGSYATRRLGTPVSHGCVRLAPANARRLFSLVQSHGLGNTRVVVHQSGRVASVSRQPLGKSLDKLSEDLSTKLTGIKRLLQR